MASFTSCLVCLECFLYIPSSNKRQLLSPAGFFPNTDVYVHQFTRYKVETFVSDVHMRQREASGYRTQIGIQGCFQLLCSVSPH